MPRLKIDVNENFEPIEVEIKGKVYSMTGQVSTEYVEKAYDMQQEGIKEGDIEAAAKQAKFLLGIPLKVGRTLDLRHLRKINDYVFECIWFPERNLSKEKKNVKSPGDTKLQK